VVREKATLNAIVEQEKQALKEKMEECVAATTAKENLMKDTVQQVTLPTTVSSERVYECNSTSTQHES